MEKIYHSLTELIGRTPLLEISHIEKKEQLKARVLVKLESFNPGGSVKDRAAFYMIEAAEKEGLLHPGSLIIEPTSGNTGIGLAWIASVKGYRLTLTMPETMSLERRNLLKALGATRFITILYTVVNMLRAPVDDVFTHEGTTDVFLKGRLIAIPNGTE